MPRTTHCGCFGPAPISRRDMLARAGGGFGLLAVGALLADDARASDHGSEHAATSPGVAGSFHDMAIPGAGRAKSVIMLFMGGGPSQVDTFDPKPELTRLHGQDVPESIAKDIPKIARAPLNNLFASPFSFRPCGQSGIPVSNLYPELGQQVDELCVIRSMRHTSPIHAPAEYMALTGTQVGNRPCLGSWVTYGLGSVCRDLPSFVVFTSEGGGRPNGWSAGFLPARYQGTVVNKSGVPNLAMPAGYTPENRRAQLDLLGRLNRAHAERLAGNSELEARIESYELAFRMQAAAPEAFDLSRESAETRQLYGVDDPQCSEFGAHCLLARRLVERGVRFIQLRNGEWDAHGKLAEAHKKSAQRTDRPIAALLADLKRRGLLEETLVVWGGEFGRTPTAQGGAGVAAGRDHSPSGYSMWLAGGGVKGGQILGATDPVGYAAIERPIHPNNLHATILAALGVDQHALFYEHQNRRELVTVNGADVVGEVFR